MWLKDTLPPPPPGTAWSLHRRGDSVQLRLHAKGFLGHEIARWGTEDFSHLTPDPVTALTEVATQIAAEHRAGNSQSAA
ncbi:hypothetical protein KZX45_17090 [Georgenia sp. EYE_87]|uniref:hypothetical protein n=1 Tax=Georgenia sp. EYE_87 TaxID=2853448 RepID=UPI002005EE0A|nr:hypothetical protein [Georgenia sp. EYE_87]MCK6212260.1 hypothetical protein [Georgenia sp. EYE_87]